MSNKPIEETNKVEGLLCDLYEQFCNMNNLPFNMAAEELLYISYNDEEKTFAIKADSAQQKFLMTFIELWEELV